MHPRRSQLITAGALLLATAAAGAAARGLNSAPPPGGAGRTTFAAPAGGPVSFSGRLDRTAVRLGSDGLARIELTIAAAPGAARRPARRATDVVIILDRSGSMDGEKMAHARAAVAELIAQLGAQDRLALVTYADDAALSIPLAAVDGEARRRWAGSVAEIQASGGTNMSSGLDLGLALVERARADGRVPHVVLISDGLANQGDATFEGLTARARRAAQGEYMLSSVGVGSDFNESLLTALADAGTGNYYYVSDPRALGDVFAREFDAARTTVAAGLAVEINPGPGVRVVDAAGYPLEPSDDGVRLRPGSLFAGQERRLWVTLAVPQHALGDYELGRFALSYGAPGQRTTLRFAEAPRVACVASEDEFYAGVDADAWSRSVLVDAYNKMQQEVAGAVREGRRDEALQRLRAFKDETASMNAQVQSAPVARQLQSADQLAAEIDDAFTGPGQEQRRNALSKAAGAAAVDARRPGSKK